ncbi:GAF domain-containing protein [Nesterenkonia salmonea]|uniref:GAF domain-containing protein n=1 Tax=Nesterenkonia salmonea TaxID=1804987 RepID=A0A5R9B8B1_9MICC|nr:helix-turn-helix domain-containing protein [Nesterenkonia salmonea]TLP93880.1 GAF domain-containing protein [Nesterenkonia salmonea]
MTASFPDVEELFSEPETAELLSAISEMSLDLANVGDREALLAAMLRRARLLLGADMAYVSLNDLAEGETYIALTDGVRTESYATIRMPFGTGVLGAAAAGGKLVLTQDYLADETLLRLPEIDRIVEREGVRAIAGAPMRVGGRVVGAFLVAHRAPRGLGARAREALEQFAVHAAVALDQARRSEEITRLRGELRVRDTGESAERRRLEDLVRLDERLMGAMVGASHEVAAVFSVLEESLDEPVALYDPTGRLLLGRDVVHEEDRPSWWLRSAIDTSLSGGGAAVARLEPGECGVMAVAAASDHLSTLVVQDSSAEALAALSHAAPFIAVMVLLGRTAAVEVELEQISLVEELIDSRAAVRPSTASRVAAHGLRLDGATAALVIDFAGEARGETVRMTRVALGGRGALLSAHDSHLCVLVNAESAHEVGASIAHNLELAGVRAIVGAAHASAGGVRGVRRAHAEAVELADAARAVGWESGFADIAALGVVGALVHDRSGVTARAIVERALGPVLTYDNSRGTELAETLHEFFAAGGALKTTATAMRVHPNTVRQRLERIDSLLGTQWRNPAEQLHVQTALQLWRLSRRGLLERFD